MQEDEVLSGSLPIEGEASETASPAEARTGGPSRPSQVRTVEDIPAGWLLRKLVLSLALPVSAEMALQTLTQIVDMAMVARLGHEAIAAVGLGFRPLFVAQATFLGLGVATQALVARAVGRRDASEASHLAAQSLVGYFPVALGFAITAFFGAGAIIEFMGGVGPVRDLGTLYILGLAPGLFFLNAGHVMTSAFRGAGYTKIPMMANLIANALNVFGNWVLIFGHLGFPRLGVLGAAIATSASRLLGASIQMVLLWRGVGPLKVDARRFAPIDPAALKRLYMVGVPAALERITLAMAQVVHMRIVATLGMVAVAAATIAINVEQISFMPAIGFSVAAGALVGQSLGAAQPARAQRSAVEAVKTSATFMAGMGALFFAIPAQLVRIFTTDPAVAALSIMLVRIVAFSQVPTGVAHTLEGALRGSGDTRSVLFITTSCAWVVRVLGSYLLVHAVGLGLAGAWVAAALDWACQTLLSSAWFRLGRWRSLSI